MKLLIDIPEYIYEDIKEIKIQYPRGSAKANQLDFYYGLLNCLKQGIPLPKGHGRLIDVDDIALIDEQFHTPSDYCIAENSIEDAPTIIEADKENENKENDKMNKENSNLTIPRALSGACFHGEVWLKCPHCGSGNQMMGRQALYKEDGYRIYKCDECGKLFKDR